MLFQKLNGSTSLDYQAIHERLITFGGDEDPTDVHALLPAADVRDRLAGDAKTYEVHRKASWISLLAGCMSVGEESKLRFPPVLCDSPQSRCSSGRSGARSPCEGLPHTQREGAKCVSFA